MLFNEESAVDRAPKVLVVDDDHLVADSLGKVLQSENFAVRLASNGLEAVDMLQQEDMDLIICDVMMPEMDGHELQGELNKYLSLQNIPFIFLSGCDDPQSKLRGVEAGADAYLSKPFNPLELIATVKGRMKRFNSRRQQLHDEKERFSTEIIRHLSHEFRTPLLAVNGGSEILTDQIKDLSEDNVESLVSSIWRGGKRLESLVNNFLLIQQIQNGQARKAYERSCQTFDIKEFLQEYLELKSRELKKQGYSFISNLSKIEDVKLQGYPHQIKQVLDRLFDNAKKFDQKNKKINFNVSEDTGFLLLSIEDSGNGFDPNSLRSITSTFYQHNRKKNEQQGGGLGLSICKFLTRINRGRIRFSNTDNGGQVSLVFPIG